MTSLHHAVRGLESRHRSAQALAVTNLSVADGLAVESRHRSAQALVVTHFFKSFFAKRHVAPSECSGTRCDAFSQIFRCALSRAIGVLRHSL